MEGYAHKEEGESKHIIARGIRLRSQPRPESPPWGIVTRHLPALTGSVTAKNPSVYFLGLLLASSRRRTHSPLVGTLPRLAPARLCLVMPRRREQPSPAANEAANVTPGRPARSVKKPKWLEDDDTAHGIVAPLESSIASTQANHSPDSVVISPGRRGVARISGSAPTPQPTPRADQGPKATPLMAHGVDQVDGTGCSSPYSRRERVPKRPSEDEIGGLKDLIPKTRAGRGSGVSKAVSSSSTQALVAPARTISASEARPLPENTTSLSGASLLRGRKRQLMDESIYSTPPRPSREIVLKNAAPSEHKHKPAAGSSSYGNGSIAQLAASKMTASECSGTKVPPVGAQSPKQHVASHGTVGAAKPDAELAARSMGLVQSATLEKNQIRPTVPSPRQNPASSALESHLPVAGLQLEGSLASGAAQMSAGKERDTILGAVDMAVDGVTGTPFASNEVPMGVLRQAPTSVSLPGEIWKAGTPPDGLDTMIRWNAMDDGLLKLAVETSMDFSEMAANLPFTCAFSPRDLEDRWFALLYDPVISAEVALQLNHLVAVPVVK
jgi:hypothetical protein